LENGVEEYIAIEPHLPFVKILEKIDDRRLKIVPGLWEQVRDDFINKQFDVLILWDVLMFMDLSVVYGEDYLNSILKEVDVFSRMSPCIFLSFHPVKERLLSGTYYHDIVHEFLRKGFRIVDQVYLNYLLSQS